MLNLGTENPFFSKFEIHGKGSQKTAEGEDKDIFLSAPKLKLKT